MNNPCTLISAPSSSRISLFRAIPSDSPRITFPPGNSKSPSRTDVPDLFPIRKKSVLSSRRDDGANNVLSVIVPYAFFVVRIIINMIFKIQEQKYHPTYASLSELLKRHRQRVRHENCGLNIITVSITIHYHVPIWILSTNH